MIVYVERKVLEDPAIANDESFVAVKKSFCTFSEGTPTIYPHIQVCVSRASSIYLIPDLYFYCCTRHRL